VEAGAGVGVGVGGKIGAGVAFGGEGGVGVAFGDGGKLEVGARVRVEDKKTAGPRGLRSRARLLRGS